MKTMRGVLGVLMALIIGISFYADFRNPFSSREIPGFDGRLRLNEVEVLRMGINPFDILSGKIYPPQGYIAGNHLVNEKWDVKPIGHKEVHTYTPWSYSFILPFSFMPRIVSGRIFWCIDTLALAAIIAFAFGIGYGLRRCWLDGVFVGAAAICLGNPFPVNSDLNNYSTLLVLAALTMCWCLNKKKDVLAGFCWALMMVKPHFGILFAIPIVLERRWKTVVVAVSTCVILSIPPALMCHTPPWEMVLNVVDKKGAGFCFQWTGFFPAQVFAFLAKFMDGQLVSGISMAMGVSMLAIMMWKIRKGGVPMEPFGGFYLLCIPVALTSPMWLYSQFQDATILSFMQIALACAIIQATDNKAKMLLAVVLLLNASRIFISVRGWFGTYSGYLTVLCHGVKEIAYVGSVAVVMSGILSHEASGSYVPEAWRKIGKR